MTPIYIVKEQKAWYCISIFYAREEWPTLIKDIISFYIYNESSIDICLIYLSTMKGEHVKVTFSSDISEICKIEKKINEHFNLFLKNRPSICMNNFSGETGIWSYYPNNTLVWNRYKIDFKEIEISQSLTLLMAYLLDDDMSADNAFSLALFLSVKLVKCLNSEERFEILNRFWDKISENSKNETINLRNDIAYNDMSNIIDDYWTLEFDDNQSIALLNRWTLDVQKILSHYSMEEGYNIILFKICTHLSHSPIIINYIIKEWHSTQIDYK